METYIPSETAKDFLSVNKPLTFKDMVGFNKMNLLKQIEGEFKRCVLALNRNKEIVVFVINETVKTVNSNILIEDIKNLYYLDTAMTIGSTVGEVFNKEDSLEVKSIESGYIVPLTGTDVNNSVA